MLRRPCLPPSATDEQDVILKDLEVKVDKTSDNFKTNLKKMKKIS